MSGSNTQFDVFIESDQYTVSIDYSDVERGMGFFASMDKDMDGGWRMGPEYVHEPSLLQRSQIVAERLMLALEGHNASLKVAMAAYIVWRVPNIKELHIDTSGDPSLTEIITRGTINMGTE